MTDKQNEDNRSYDFFPEIPMTEPPVNDLVTEGHANYKRLEGRLGKKTGISLFLGIVGLCLVGSYSYTNAVADIYEGAVSESTENGKSYQSIGGSQVIGDHIASLGSKISAETTYFSAEEFQKRVTTISEILVAGNGRALYEIPGVSVDGLKHGVSGKEILVTPSFEVISSPENPGIKSIGGKLGYVISGIVTYSQEYQEEVKGKDGEIEIVTKTRTMTAPKVVALRLDDGRVYEITITPEERGSETRPMSGPVIFDNFADAKNIQTFGHGLLEDDIQGMIASELRKNGGSLVRDLDNGTYSPGTIQKGVSSILAYMQNNNGAIFPQLTHKISSFSEFKKEGFADKKTRDYSVTKFIKLDLGGQQKMLMLTVAKLDNGGVAPVAGLITKEGGSYSYQNIDLGENWVKLEGFEAVGVSELGRELIALSGIKELTINKNEK